MKKHLNYIDSFALHVLPSSLSCVCSPRPGARVVMQRAYIGIVVDFDDSHNHRSKVKITKKEQQRKYLHVCVFGYPPSLFPQVGVGGFTYSKSHKLLLMLQRVKCITI